MANDTNKRLVGKVAIITGAGSGIGKATAKNFAEQGALLVLNDIHGNRLDELLEEIENRENHIIIAGDISKEETANQLSAAAIKKHGRIDILVNNAGIHYIEDIKM